MSKIKNIKFITKKYSYKKPFHIANSFATGATNVEVEIETEEGIKGFGEASPSWRVCGETSDSVVSLLNKAKSILNGKDIERYSLIFKEMSSFIFSPSLVTAIEFAVIDALCKKNGIRVWKFLGGNKNEIETDKTVSISSVDDMVTDSIKIKREGFNIIKIKTGENLSKDIEVIEEIYRKTKGLRYIVDANTGYTPKEAICFAKKIYSKGIDISVFEQPVNRYDIESLKLVRFNSPFPVCADESVKTKYDALNLIKKEAVDYINIKLMKSGFSQALSIIELALSSNIKLMIGCMSESSVGINQSVHLACGRGVFDFCDLDSHLLIKEDKIRGDFVQNKNIIRVKP